jgi:hypothetical protein
VSTVKFESLNYTASNKNIKERNWRVFMRIVFFTTIVLVLASMSLNDARAQSTILVSPSGGDDTVAIQTAFNDAVVGGPGSSVHFLAGTYCVSSPIIVRGFAGNWLGSGRNKTIIKTCTKPDPFPVPAYIVSDPAYPVDPLLEIISPFVFIEVEGGPPSDLHIADLTIHLEGETNPWYAHGNAADPLTIFRPAILVAGKRPSVVDGVISTASVSVDRIVLRASPDGVVFSLPSDTNIDNGIIVRGGLEGTVFQTVDIEPIEASVSVTRSHFDQVAFSAVQTPMCTNCDITVGGRQNFGNSFSLLYGAPLVGYSVGSSSSIVVSHNRGEAQFGAIDWFTIPHFFPSTPLPPPTEPSYIEVAHNQVDIFDHFINASYGMFLDDWSLRFGVQAMHALITDNTIRQIDIGYGKDALAGILHLGGKDTQIWNNRISGDFLWGGIVAGFAFPGAVGDNLSIVGNNLRGTSAGVASIWLGPFTSNSLVVGGPNRKNVLDQGVGNVVTGVNNMNGNPPGPELQEAIEQMLDSRNLPTWP